MGVDVTVNDSFARVAAGHGFRLMAALAAATALAGCSSGASETGGSRVGGLFGFGSQAPAPPARDPKAPQIRSCPEATVLDGGAALRVGGPAAQSVRHQFAISNVERECQFQNGQLVMKVGVEGNLVVGPAGSGGTQSASIRVSLRSEADQRVLASRSYRVSATASASESGPFTLVTDSFSAPFLSEYASDDYTIMVAFEGSSAAAQTRRARRR